MRSRCTATPSYPVHDDLERQARRWALVLTLVFLARSADNAMMRRIGADAAARVAEATQFHRSTLGQMTNDPEMASRHVSQVIRCDPSTVYDFAADPANLPRWAQGLSRTEVTVVGDELIADSPMGQVRVRFVPRNDLGVLDHDVTLPDGKTVTNPLRVLTHPQGAEILFTVRQLDLTDEQFEQDVQTVAEDLQRLTSLLERA